MEISQIRSEIEKRIAEKEEEFENTRKTHQRALDSMQASLEAESRARAELVKSKKKLESDIGVGWEISGINIFLRNWKLASTKRIAPTWMHKRI